MKGSILFNKDINIEVDVDPSAEEGARLVSAKNLVDGQEAGGGGGGVATVVLVNNTGYMIEEWFWTIISETLDGIITTNNSESGTYLCPLYHEGLYVLYPLSFDNLTLSGEAETYIDEETNEAFILVKGDCTITINA